MGIRLPVSRSIHDKDEDNDIHTMTNQLSFLLHHHNHNLILSWLQGFYLASVMYHRHLSFAAK